MVSYNSEQTITYLNVSLTFISLHCVILCIVLFCQSLKTIRTSVKSFYFRIRFKDQLNTVFLVIRYVGLKSLSHYSVLHSYLFGLYNFRTNYILFPKITNLFTFCCISSSQRTYIGLGILIQLLGAKPRRGCGMIPSHFVVWEMKESEGSSLDHPPRDKTEMMRMILGCSSHPGLLVIAPDSLISTDFQLWFEKLS